MKRWLLGILLTLWLVATGWGAIPEVWFTHKAELLASTETTELPTRDELFAMYARRSVEVATLPKRYMAAFAEMPKSPKIYVGEAYFIDHCVHHHPDVEDAIYRQIQAILDAPDEVIIDRREERDGLVFSKALEGKTYALVIRRYPDGTLAYKTLFPVGKKLYPRLPRFSAQ